MDNLATNITEGSDEEEKLKIKSEPLDSDETEDNFVNVQQPSSPEQQRQEEAGIKEEPIEINDPIDPISVPPNAQAVNFSVTVSDAVRENSSCYLFG